MNRQNLSMRLNNVWRKPEKEGSGKSNGSLTKPKEQPVKSAKHWEHVPAKNGTETKNLMNDWCIVLALAIQLGGRKQFEDMAKIWAALENPQT